MHFAFFLLRVGHNEIIGVNRVGSHAEGLGRDHWNEMLAYPRKPIAHWHSLLEASKSQKEVLLLTKTQRKTPCCLSVLCVSLIAALLRKVVLAMTEIWLMWLSCLPLLNALTVSHSG